ncbi:5171_t:CDS:2, partial [Funneliformis caledonium]
GRNENPLGSRNHLQGITGNFRNFTNNLGVRTENSGHDMTAITTTNDRNHNLGGLSLDLLRDIIGNGKHIWCLKNRCL